MLAVYIIESVIITLSLYLGCHKVAFKTSKKNREYFINCKVWFIISVAIGIMLGIVVLGPKLIKLKDICSKNLICSSFGFYFIVILISIHVFWDLGYVIGKAIKLTKKYVDKI